MLTRATLAVRGWMEGSLIALDVPIRSQFDGSEYQASNCGPSSLAMVLEAFGVTAPTGRLRNLANTLQGTYDRDSGIGLQYLGDIAAEAGVRPLGLRDAAGFHRWSVDEVRAEVRHGHPVITLVRMRELPDYANSRADTDHYVVVVGLDAERLLVNDPARPGDAGFHRALTAQQLEHAWDASSIPRQAIAFGAPEGLAELAFPAPGAGSGPGAAVIAVVPSGPEAQPTFPTAAMTLPQPSQSGPAPQIVVVITPAPPPVIYVNITMPSTMPTPAPMPTRDRWARPEMPPSPALESPTMPSGQPDPIDSPTPTADERWARQPTAAGAPTLVLSENLSVPPELPLRWLARLAMLGVGALTLRWALR